MQNNQDSSSQHSSPTSPKGTDESSNASGVSPKSNLWFPMLVNSIDQNEKRLAIKDIIDAAIKNDVNQLNRCFETFKISPNELDDEGISPLIYASINGNVNIVRRLIELDANVDFQEPYTKNTALHYAAQCGHTRTAQVLINAGKADKEIPNLEGKTPFQLAKDFGHGNNKIMKSLFCVDDQQSLQSSSSSSSTSSSLSLMASNNIGSSSSSLDSINSGEINIIQCGHDFNNNNRNSSKMLADNYQMIKNGVVAGKNPKQNGGGKQVVNSNSNANSNGIKKNISYLPNPMLLERFSQCGCYRLFAGGYGFQLLASDGPPQQMICEAFKSLEIPTTDINSLILALKRIIQELQENNKLIGKEYETFNIHDHQDHHRLNNLQVYNRWLKDNIDKIIKMINYLQQWQSFLQQNNGFLGNCSK